MQMITGANDFDDAENEWDLQRLYLDLAEVVGKELAPRQKKLLRGLLCGYSPKEIAWIGYQNPNSKSILPDLSMLYRHIENLVFNSMGNLPLVTWGHVRPLLEKAGYRKSSFINKS
jgi:hypothetical protein